MERGHFQKNHGMETKPTEDGGGGWGWGEQAALREKLCPAPLKYEVGLLWEDEKKVFKSSFPHKSLHIQLHSLGCFITLRNIFKTDTSKSICL